MYTYDIFQWMLFFFIYCFFGWCIESTIVSINKRRLVNRGFLRIPMLPLYGSGAVLILFLTIPVQDIPWLVYIIGALGATVLEYITGWAMESLFKMKYWDYSDQRFQLHGRICLTSSLFWGVLSVALTEYIHPPIEHWLLKLDHILIVIASSLIFCVMVIDTIISTKAALDLAKILEHLSIIREEIESLRTQLEELKETSQQQLEELKEASHQHLEDWKEASHQQLTEWKETAQQHIEDIIETKDNLQSAMHAQLKEHTTQLKARLTELSEQRENEMSHLGFLKSQLLKGHPSAYSQKFNDTLRELKDRLYK